MFNEWTWQVFCNAAFGPTVPVKIWANVVLDVFVSSLLPVLKLQVWRDDREVRLLWQRALDRHNEEWFTIVYSYFESTWTLKPGIVASNVEQCILWGLLVPGLFHAFWASAIALHCLAETLEFFWNESGGHRVSGASAGAPSTLVALQFFGPLRRLTSHYLIASSFWESAARCRHFWVQERPITDLYDLLFDIIYIFFIAFIEYSLIVCDFHGKFWPVAESTSRCPSIVHDFFGVDWGTFLTC